MTEQNRFDQRLYYALSAFILRLPSLGERGRRCAAPVRFFFELVQPRIRKTSSTRFFGHSPAPRTSMAGKSPRTGKSVPPSRRDVRVRRDADRRAHRNGTRRQPVLPALGFGRALDGDPPSRAGRRRKKPSSSTEKKYTFDDLHALDSYYNGKRNLLAEKLGISRSTLWRYFKMMEDAAVQTKP